MRGQLGKVGEWLDLLRCRLFRGALHLARERPVHLDLLPRRDDHRDLLPPSAGVLLGQGLRQVQLLFLAPELLLQLGLHGRHLAELVFQTPILGIQAYACILELGHLGTFLLQLLPQRRPPGLALLRRRVLALLQELPGHDQPLLHLRAVGRGLPSALQSRRPALGEPVALLGGALRDPLLLLKLGGSALLLRRHSSRKLLPQIVLDCRDLHLQLFVRALDFLPAAKGILMLLADLRELSLSLGKHSAVLRR
mmetsp:Transcript_33605/g.104721  ORF Transcript_33605/g.104721 Transcript_33605/m.104721 type:complete len:252 (+) Transcript_33605:390-1145(+)